MSFKARGFLLKNVCTTDLWLFNLKYKYIFRGMEKCMVMALCGLEKLQIVFSKWETVININSKLYIKQWNKIT